MQNLAIASRQPVLRLVPQSFSGGGSLRKGEDLRRRAGHPPPQKAAFWRRRVKLKDIARKTGLSVPTVSHVLNSNSRRYNPTTCKRVRRVAARLGYLPNRLAQAMVKGKSGVIGLVGQHFGTWITIQRIDAMVTRAEELGFRVFLSGRCADNATEQANIEDLLAHQVDGLVIFIKAEGDLSFHQSLQDRGVRLVLLGNHSKPGRLPLVSMDIEEGAYQATRHLLALGHRDIALALGKYTASLPHDRLTGCKRALREARLVLAENRVFRDPILSLRTAHEFTQRQMRRTPSPTAIIYNNDEMAQAGMLALREMGLSVPRDVSVVGYDDLPIAEFTHPPLTTLRQPREELARAVLQLLTDQIHGVAERPTPRVVFTPKLMVRQSTAPFHPRRGNHFRESYEK